MAQIIDRVPRTVSRWRRSSRGSISIVMAFAALILLAASGCAIDYVMYLQYRSKLQAVSDSAALGAIAAARQAEEKGLGVSAAAKAARDAAQSIWNTNSLAAGIQQIQPAIAVAKAGDNWNAAVDSRGTYRTNFMGLIGFKEMLAADSARATTTMTKKLEYWEYHIVVDTSGSMGIGATKEIMDRMYADPDMDDRRSGSRVSCQFACHDKSGDRWADNTVAVARAKGYTLRIDLVDDAVDKMLNTMISASWEKKNVKAKLWGLSGNARPLVETTSQLASIRDYDIQINPVDYSFGNTHFPNALQTLTAALGKSGDGRTPDAPKKAVFLVTDGVYDTKQEWHFGISTLNKLMYNNLHLVGAMEAQLCEGLKRNGVTVGVLYVDYVPALGASDIWVDPIRPYILPGLRGCASPNLFYNATTPQGIQKAMQDMLRSASGNDRVRLNY